MATHNAQHIVMDAEYEKYVKFYMEKVRIRIPGSITTDKLFITHNGTALCSSSVGQSMNRGGFGASCTKVRKMVATAVG